ncbi:hypothetical protein [Pseudohongiella nitratireducens]|uniref:hypothetical protein n=1 Tax=Pseudohongiella nitratireducens TaxID=1768907 RepID=UPI0030EF0C26|tara:strand:+ start:5114 stop:5317 length:204 start_codon:yes stop_codon:yes gene_type:complete
MRKIKEFIFNVIIGITIAAILISIYGGFRDAFSSPTGYEFSEYGYHCIVVKDGGQPAMWCEPEGTSK